MIERLILVAAVAVLVVIGVVLGRVWARQRSAKLLAVQPERFWSALEVVPDQRPTIVSFSTQSCGACRTVQAPALAALELELGRDAVRVLRVDAIEKPTVAKTFGVMTVPSTVVLAPGGGVRAINHGFASADRLADQLHRAI